MTGHLSNPGPPWLSILIPVYNVEPYLRACVESIMAQSLGASAGGGVETILLDDCSADGSLRLCQQLEREFPGRLRLVRHAANRGIGAARNSLLSQAQGHYVWFIDADDYLTRGALSQLQHIIHRDEPDLVICNYYKQRSWLKKSFPGGGRKIEHSQQSLIAGVFQYRKMYIWLKIAKRSLWNGLQFPAEECFEDIATTPYLLLRAGSYYYTPQRWIYYRVRPGSLLANVARRPDIFDIEKNEGAAGALTGYADALIDRFGEIPPELAYYMSHFIAKEYIKLARRYRKAARQSSENIPAYPPRPVPPIGDYRRKMESSSPLSFDMLRHQYLMRGQPWDYLALTRAMAIV